MSVRIQLRRDTAANWTSTNPTLTQGEPGYETDTGKIKYGDGSTAWNSLAYAPAAAVVDGTIVDGDISASAEIAVSKLADGAARQLLQTDAAGTGVEWASDIDIPGTLDVTGAAVFDSSVAVTGTLTKSGSNVVTVGDTGTVTSTMIANGTIVDGDVNASAAIAGTKISPDFGSQTVQTTGVISHALGTAGAPTVTFTGDTNTGIYSPGADQLAISTGGTGRLFVDSSGNIGIGTGSPVNSANYSSLTLQGATGGQIALRAGSTLKSYFFNDASKTTIGAVDDFVIATTGSITERLRITSAGLVGIGTSTPNVRTHIVGTALTKSWSADSNDFLAVENSSTSAIDIRSGSAAGGNIFFSDGDARSRGRIEYSHVADELRFGTAGTNSRVVIDSSGRLLVGATSTSSTATVLLQGNSTGATSFGSFRLARGTNSPADGAALGYIAFSDSGHTEAVEIIARRDGGTWNTSTSRPTRLEFSTTADGSATPAERLRITSAGVLQIADAGNISVGTTTGTKIGTATTQKLGFYNKTPVVQPTAVADATDAASVITQLNALLARMRDLGLIAT